jgi:hypothetical protein
MSSAGVLIFFALVASFICARVRVAGGAVVFAVIATLLFVGTPVGAGLPGLMAEFLSTIQQAAAPLTQGGHHPAGVG